MPHCFQLNDKFQICLACKVNIKSTPFTRRGFNEHRMRSTATDEVQLHNFRVNKVILETKPLFFLPKNRIHIIFPQITNWNAKYWYCKCKLTFRPTRLLWRFIRLRSSFSISRASRNFLVNRIPKPISAEHPPHFQLCRKKKKKGKINCTHGREIIIAGRARWVVSEITEDTSATSSLLILTSLSVENCIFCFESQPHIVMFPLAHAAVIAWTAPALVIPYVNAASREPLFELINNMNEYGTMY